TLQVDVERVRLLSQVSETQARRLLREICAGRCNAQRHVFRPLLRLPPLAAELPWSGARQPSGDVPAETLSARERAVLQLIAEGLSNQQISERLFISLPTVKTHARNINAKLGVQRRTEAVARAQQHGWLG